jgi:hypothetical protein
MRLYSGITLAFNAAFALVQHIEKSAHDVTPASQ